MKSSKSIMIIALGLMTLLSLTNLIGLPVAGLAVIIGLIFFFVYKRIDKQSQQGSGLDIRTIGDDLKTPMIWFLIMMPSLMNLFTIFLSKLILPEYVSHVLTRSAAIISFDNLSTLVVQVAVLALGEEIAWRAFYQKRLRTFIPIVPAVLISSVFFAVGHLSNGSTVIVLYDLFFIFINSIVYGIVFEKTNNAWVSAISHICANLMAFGILFFL